MSGFNIGDRVELIREIGHYYPARIGIITSAGTHPVSLLREFLVRLADGTKATFSGFQLRTPTATAAHKLLDSAASAANASGMRGSPGGRHLLFAAEGFDIHLKLASSERRKIVVGQLTSETSKWNHALVTLLVQDAPHVTTSTDSFGEFLLEEIPSGNVSIEILVPSYRVVATFEA
jgi:hypothetical protein